MKKLMMLSLVFSLQSFAAENSDWKMNPKKRVMGLPVGNSDEADSKYFVTSSTGDEIGLNHRGNPVFVARGSKCEQGGKWFVVHSMPFVDNIAQHHEELLCSRLGNKESHELRKTLQLKMRE